MSYPKNVKKLLGEIFIPEKAWGCILFAVIPSLAFYILTLVGMTNAGFTISKVLKDTAQINETSSFLGFLSNIGVFIWVSAAAICFFSAFTATFAATDNRKNLLLLTGLLSTLLAFDDFFMIHDRYINQNICYLIYGVCAITLLIRYCGLIIEIDGFAFLIACSLLALSIFTDLVQSYIPFHRHYVQAFEDGFKFTGAATWLYFNCRVASFRPAFSALDAS